MKLEHTQPGATYLGNGHCQFVVWAPHLNEVAVKLVGPHPRLMPMRRDDYGYWQVVAEDVQPGTRYVYALGDGDARPDPASRFQPEGVHGASAVVDHRAFEWQDRDWQNVPLDELIIYELHVGTFTPAGTFEAIIPRLDDLRRLGVTALEIMPVAQFPGERNWGYDGVYPFAVQNSYGGPAGFKRLVNACHRKGLAVILDVVYNHLGPEGNYLGCFAPYFTACYQTPWGNAINFDGAYSYGVRDYFIANALYWAEHFHLDGLRLDATQAILDHGAKHFLEELAEAVAAACHRRGRPYHLIAESDLNDRRVTAARADGGYGLDAQWCDDFHHSLRTLLTGERHGYYEDFGRIEQLAKAYDEGFVYSWQYSPHRKRLHGSSSRDLPARRFVVFATNHDQIGNRMFGERLSALVSFEAQKLAACAVLLSPYVPLIFMGEEYGEQTPFLYFISHGDAALVEAVRQGRKTEFAAFKWAGEPPDPQSLQVFQQSTLSWEGRHRGQQQTMLAFYTALLRLRKMTPALAALDKERLEARVLSDKLLRLHRWDGESQIIAVMNFAKRAAQVAADFPAGRWQKQLDSADAEWGGPGSAIPPLVTAQARLRLMPQSCAVFKRDAARR
ncbi:MAG TPA: malto-oligosyltrehalose trehalohydrolase [Blastocatellia bacterium]|nr:malto-oligosyltrehalose trehalohydrolase [Blastocatellia bacterium]